MYISTNQHSSIPCLSSYANATSRRTSELRVMTVTRRRSESERALGSMYDHDPIEPTVPRKHGEEDYSTNSFEWVESFELPN
ncbi:hypothetical protein PHLGIDRAFT_223903 [Phlebiopsis gigantea 11061_1 CR5-6]|uniref:Uncharacterized protein n=1 Tax=Phlebiopsis gigantea (strain 11061_1 CR5-6) TaxID=745531 RepID=A0A0C3PEG4_PHLG1|nr:hypothetical protein PHLGIDRAFT_223903 [Phlebiopsis gigantea 11061_1 CR5-6]